eukprot:Nk52_evm11s1224 gene=Nk52_evmTU11s1224
MDYRKNADKESSAASVKHVKDGIGIGLDSCVIPTKHEGVFLVQTTDFFYPLIDNPYIMGEIACANVLSDLYAMGIYDCDNMLMLFGLSREMDVEERSIVSGMMVKGFVDQAVNFGETLVTGGQTVMNPWVMMGGVATKVARKGEFIVPDLAESGDVLILTKPLGTQVCVNLYEWLDKNSPRWDMAKNIVNAEEAKHAYKMAIASMRHLNRNAALLMQKYGAHGSTDVTGFGILGHSRNLAEFQKNNVCFNIHTLPIFNKMAEVNAATGNIFKLKEGLSSETSGGLLVMLPKKQAGQFVNELYEMDGKMWKSWVVGEVVEATERTAKIVPDAKVVDVDFAAP